MNLNNAFVHQRSVGRQVMTTRIRFIVNQGSHAIEGDVAPVQHLAGGNSLLGNIGYIAYLRTSDNDMIAIHAICSAFHTQALAGFYQIIFLYIHFVYCHL